MSKLNSARVHSIKSQPPIPLSISFLLKLLYNFISFVCHSELLRLRLANEAKLWSRHRSSSILCKLGIVSYTDKSLIYTTELTSFTFQRAELWTLDVLGPTVWNQTWSQTSASHLCPAYSEEGVMHLTVISPDYYLKLAWDLRDTAMHSVCLKRLIQGSR